LDKGEGRMNQFKYVEMICELDQTQQGKSRFEEGVEVEPIRNINTDMLFDCYVQSFNKGDAKFYKQQDEQERRRYFDEELGFPDVLNCPASFAYKIKDRLIGFALVLPYLKNNYHLSCMCILPEYQNHGIGKSMLHRIKQAALDNGCKTLTLGTETEMKAYHLYKSNGFMVTEEHTVEI
jgi:GNAT superfamily N-acetyltransferase